MKKVLMILVASLFVLTSAFAKPASSASDVVNLRLYGQVLQSEYLSQLTYGGKNVYDGDVLNRNDRFNLNDVTISKDFQILITSNYLTRHTIVVKVSSTPFTRDIIGNPPINDTSPSQKTSLDTRVKNFNSNGIIYLPNGYLNNYLAKTFNIVWTKDNTLASGKYTSTIIVDYVVGS